MAAGKRKFDTISVPKLGIEITVYVKTSGDQKGWYCASYGPDEVEASTYPECQKQVLAAIERATNLVWFPVMEISIEWGKEWGSHEAYKQVMKLVRSRYYVAKTPDGKGYRMVSWDEKPEERIEASSELQAIDHKDRRHYRHVNFNALPDQAYSHGWSDGHQDITHYLPYDQATWDGIEFISQQLGALALRLQELVATTEGRELVASKALKMLAAPEPEKGAKAC